MNKLDNVMNNVMAALNTFGIEYDVNEISAVPICEEKEELLKSEQEVLNFKNKNFFQNFKSFTARPQYSRISGKCWADDGKYVIIQFKRSYIMTDEDWEKYAIMCGCSDPFEAQGLYGDPNTGYIFLNVRIEKGHLRNFVSSYAHFCWTA